MATGEPTRLAVAVAWALVGLVYVTQAFGDAIRASSGVGYLIMGVLVAGAAASLAFELRAPADAGRRWRLAWSLGAFHVGFVGTAGAIGGQFLFASMVDRGVIANLIIWAAAVGLAGAALRSRDLAGSFAGILGVRALAAGAAMGVVVLATVAPDALFSPFAWVYAVPTGVGWALGFWLLDSAMSAVLALVA